MQVTILSERVYRVRSEILILGFFQDIRPLTGYAGEIDWLTNGTISSLILQNKIKGVLGEAILLATPKMTTPKILLIGLGQKNTYSYRILQQLSHHVFEILTRLKVNEPVCELWGQEACALDLLRCLDILFEAYSKKGIRGSPQEVATTLTLLTHHSDRVKEMARRIRELERTQTASEGSGPANRTTRIRHAESKP